MARSSSDGGTKRKAYYIASGKYKNRNPFVLGLRFMFGGEKSNVFEHTENFTDNILKSHKEHCSFA